ncbi:MAG: branched-chain amino acid ABC transporter permease [Anaerolineae bacterium]|nr:branched-chain amino acid ABC transporter permease [Anaerolineae bacterium]
MERTVIERSFQDRLSIFLRGNLPAVVVIGFSIVLAIFIAIETGPSQIANIIVTGGMWALLAAGLALVFGVMNIPHFAHGESFMVGAYVGYFVFTPISNYLKDNPNAVLSFIAPVVGVIAAAIVGAIMGAVIERLVFAPLRKRTRAGWVMNTFLLTVGLSFVLVYGTTLIIGPNFRGIPRYYDVPPIDFLGMRVAVDRIFAFVIAIITIAALTYFMQKTRTGRAIRAVSQDETGAQLVGINLGFIHTLTFALATAMAAMAGAALLFMFQAYPTVGLKPLYLSWYVVMMVGLGNVYGAIIGGFIVALLQTATQQFFGISWDLVVPTALMILILILVPSGIFGSEVKGIQEQ